MIIRKKFIDSVASARAGDQIKYSIDIQKRIDDNKITEEQLAALLSKMLNKDFGSVDKEVARRFGNHMDAGDKDVYGVYDDIVIYYDQDKDDITYCSLNEFTRYYKLDWDREDRKAFNARYEAQRRNIGGRAPEDGDLSEWKKSNIETVRILKEGQHRESKKVAEQEYGVGVYGLSNFIKNEWKTIPVENYASLAKSLGIERTKQIDAWAKELGVPSKKLMSIIAYNYYVQHKPISASFDYLENNLIKERRLGMLMSDSKR